MQFQEVFSHAVRKDAPCGKFAAICSGSSGNYHLKSYNPRMIAELSFYGIGQGLFSVGTISFHNGKKFQWVYDCGTTSAQKLLTKKIDYFTDKICTDDNIDFLAISHFDNDHISGVTKLLMNCNVKRILLPYVPLWQRLVSAFENNVSLTSNEMELCLDPVRVLKRLLQESEHNNETGLCLKTHEKGLFLGQPLRFLRQLKN